MGARYIDLSLVALHKWYLKMTELILAFNQVCLKNKKGKKSILNY
jgi:hypothetical protein